LNLTQRLAEARIKYRSDYPPLRQVEAQIADLESLKKRLAADAVAKAASAQKGGQFGGTSANPNGLDLAEVDSKLKVNELELVNQRKNIDEVQKQIQDVRRRVNMTPVREQQLSQINRTYENARAHYQSLLQKKLQSELASNLEKRQGGEQFRILDPASLPTKPDGRIKILGVGWFVGICMGLGLAVLREVMSPCVNDEADVKAVTQLPVFRVPVIRTQREVLVGRLRLAVEVLVAIFLAVAAIGSSTRTYLLS
jgi:uncharacterized protein involved in exopolysaccharide biosynthesis